MEHLAFCAQDVCDYARITRFRLQRWMGWGVIRPSLRRGSRGSGRPMIFSPRDADEARVARELRELDVPLSAIVPLLEKMREAPDGEAALAVARSVVAVRWKNRRPPWDLRRTDGFGFVDAEIKAAADQGLIDEVHRLADVLDRHRP